jgi:hypothetical protein
VRRPDSGKKVERYVLEGQEHADVPGHLVAGHLQGKALPVSHSVRLIGYRTWQRDLRARGWRSRRDWAVLLVLLTAAIAAGGMWPLAVTPAVLLIDYVGTCMRQARLPDAPKEGDR